MSPTVWPSSPSPTRYKPVATTSSRPRAGSALLPHFRASGNGAMRFRHGGKVATVITESSKNASPSFFFSSVSFFFFLSSSVAILYIRISSSLVSHCLSRWMHVRLKKDNKMSMKRISKAIKSKLTESIAKLVFFFFIKKYTLCR